MSIVHEKMKKSFRFNFLPSLARHHRASFQESGSTINRVKSVHLDILVSGHVQRDDGRVPPSAVVPHVRGGDQDRAEDGREKGGGGRTPVHRRYGKSS